MNFKSLFLILILFCSNRIKSQTITVLGAKYHYGNVYLHTPNVRNIKGAKPRGIELEYSKIPIDSVSINKCNCFPRNGIALNLYNFDKPFLGNGYMIAYFLEAEYPINNSISFVIRPAAGISFESNPYNSSNNKENKSYVSYFNHYLQLGAGLNIKLGKNLAISLRENFQHFSNGGFKEPNRGLNWITFSTGILYYHSSNNLQKFRKTQLNIWRRKPVSFVVGSFLVPSQGYNSSIKGRRLDIEGIFGSVQKQYGRISSITGGIEMYKDHFIIAGKNSNYFVSGIHAGHIFNMGNIGFSQQVGIHLFDQLPDSKIIYLRFGLTYIVKNQYLVGINLKTHSDNAEFTDLRLGFEF